MVSYSKRANPLALTVIISPPPHPILRMLYGLRLSPLTVIISPPPHPILCMLYGLRLSPLTVIISPPPHPILCMLHGFMFILMLTLSPIGADTQLNRSVLSCVFSWLCDRSSRSFKSYNWLQRVYWIPSLLFLRSFSLSSLWPPGKWTVIDCTLVLLRSTWKDSVSQPTWVTLHVIRSYELRIS